MQRFKIFISSDQVTLYKDQLEKFHIGNDFKVTIWRAGHVHNSTSQQKTRENTREKAREKTREKLLRIVRENPDVTANQLAIQLGKTPKGIEWQINKLKKEGLLIRVGSDNGGHWEVKG